MRHRSRQRRLGCAKIGDRPIDAVEFLRHVAAVPCPVADVVRVRTEHHCVPLSGAELADVPYPDDVPRLRIEGDPIANGRILLRRLCDEASEIRIILRKLDLLADLKIAAHCHLGIQGRGIKPSRLADEVRKDKLRRLSLLVYAIACGDRIVVHPDAHARIGNAERTLGFCRSQSPRARIVG